MRRVRIVSWPVPCSALPDGCPEGMDPCNPLPPRTSATSRELRDRRHPFDRFQLGRRGDHVASHQDREVLDISADRLMPPWLRSRYGREGHTHAKRLLIGLALAVIIACMLTCYCFPLGASAPTVARQPAPSLASSVALTPGARPLGRVLSRVACWLLVLAAWAVMSSVYLRGMGGLSSSPYSMTPAAEARHSNDCRSEKVAVAGPQSEAASSVGSATNIATRRPIMRAASTEGCPVTGNASVRVALVVYGRSAPLEVTAAGLRTHLMRPVREHGDDLDVFAHLLLDGARAADESMADGAAGFLAQRPCGFAADDMSLADERLVGIFHRTPYSNWTTSDLLTEAASIKQRRARARRVGAVKPKGQQHDDLDDPSYAAILTAGGKSGAEAAEDVKQTLRSLYSMAEVARLVVAHEAASGFEYTHIVAARTDVAIFGVVAWRPWTLTGELPHVRVPNIGHGARGVSDRLAYGPRYMLMPLLRTRYDQARRAWRLHPWKSREELLCDAAAHAKIRVGVVPACLVSTSPLSAAERTATDGSKPSMTAMASNIGLVLPEVLNATRSPIGLPLGCASLPLVTSPHDAELACPPLVRTPVAATPCLQRSDTPFGVRDIEMGITAGSRSSSSSPASAGAEKTMVTLRTITCDVDE